MQLITQNVSRIVVALVLVVVLLGLLTWTGIVRCSMIPGWCEVYYSVLGQPRVLIAHCGNGMGDPEDFRLELGNPAGPNIRARVGDLRNLSAENLKEYQLIVVEHCRRMSTKSMKDLLSYADAGGKMVWTGDAGAELGPGDEFLYEDELKEDANHSIIGPWARKSEGYVVNLENYLSVSYKGTYCGVTGCDPDTQFISGQLIPVDNDHPLIYGMQSGIAFKGDFAVVAEKGGVGTKRVLNIDTDTGIVAGGQNLGQVLPFIVTSGVGERIAYYAFPPEHLAKQQYRVLFENLYYGMVE
jgi:hypothetical protein